MSRPKGAMPVGVSNVDMKTEVWGVWHHDHMQEVVLVEDFNSMAKELLALRIKLDNAYVRMAQLDVFFDPAEFEK
jgi:hypothetical protein